LRKKQIALGKQPGNGLGALLTSALGTSNIGYPQSKPKLKHWADSLPDFLNNLEDILNNATSPELRWIHSLYLVRNFTGHHFDITETVTSKSGKSFFKHLYVDTMKSVIMALLYLKHMNEV
jgi:hypothetical protein